MFKERFYIKYTLKNGDNYEANYDKFFYVSHRKRINEFLLKEFEGKYGIWDITIQSISKIY
ncbi:MAG: hypothetical protein AABY22_34370 [Nanoarchaeota archaeon]